MSRKFMSLSVIRQGIENLSRAYPGVTKAIAVKDGLIVAAAAVTRYVADSTAGEEIIVVATGAGVTASRTGSTVSFTIPGGVQLLSARIRIQGPNTAGGVLTVDSGFGAAGLADGYPATFYAWREDTGQFLAAVASYGTAAGLANEDQIAISGLNATATNCVRLDW